MSVINWGMPGFGNTLIFKNLQSLLAGKIYSTHSPDHSSSRFAQVLP